MSPRTPPLLAVAATIGLLALAVPLPAHAEARDLSRLGGSDRIVLTGPSGEDEMLAQIPTGMRPDRLRGTVTRDPGAEDGWLVVSVGDRQLDTIELTGAGTTDLDVDLSGLDDADLDGAANLPLRFTETSRTDWCGIDGPATTVIDDLQLELDGQEAAPTTVGEFFGPGVERVELVVPDDPSPEVATAAIRLAAGTSLRYPTAPPEVTVTGAPAGSGAVELGSRRIVVSGSDTPGLALDSDPRVLTIGGDGPRLAGQVDLLLGPDGALATGRTAEADGPPAAPQTVPDTQSLADLAVNSDPQTGPGTVSVPLGVDSAALGAVPADLELHLVGTALTGATPAADGSRGTIALWAGERILQSWPLSGDGAFDLTATVPADSIGRYTDLSLQVSVNGAGDCAQLPEVTVGMDPSSTITLTPATPPQGRGFADLLAALMPGYLIAGDRPGAEGVADAAAMAVALQQLTSTPLHPRWASVEQATTSREPAVFLLDDQPPPDPLPVGLRYVDDRWLLPDGQAVAGAGPTSVWQVGRDDQRTVAVLSSVGGIDRRGMFDWLTAPGSMARLSGDTALWTPDADRPQTLSLQIEPVAGQTATGVPGWVLPAAGGVLLLAVGTAVGVVVGRRRADATA